MKLWTELDRRLRGDGVHALSCLLFLCGAALLLCLAALVDTQASLAAVSAAFAAVLLVDAACLLRAGRPQRRDILVLTLAAAVYAFCLLRAGGVYPLWLLLLPVCVLPLLGLRQGAALCLSVLVLALLYTPRADGAWTLPVLYGALCLLGGLLACLRTYDDHRHARQVTALETLSRTDALTGICNRWWYNEQLKEHNGQPEYRRRYVLLLIDLDHFKDVNDTYGHLCGDQVLIDTARIIETAFQKDGLVCHWGGDEFLAQARAASPEEALTMAEQLRSTIAATPFRAPDGGTFHITASIGAVYVPDPHDIYSNELFSIADHALYEAKNGGRDRVGFRVTRTSADTTA